jgi:hypothetical protein
MSLIGTLHFGFTLLDPSWTQLISFNDLLIVNNNLETDPSVLYILHNNPFISSYLIYCVNVVFLLLNNNFKSFIIYDDFVSGLILFIPYVHNYFSEALAYLHLNICLPIFKI